MNHELQIENIPYPSRTKGRQLAVNLVYCQLLTGSLPERPFWKHLWQEGGVLDDPAAESWADHLCQQLELFKSAIRAELGPLLRGWRWERLALVDQAILLLAALEMKYLRPPISYKVVIDEYVEIAKTVGHEESFSFINGVLDNFAQSIPWQKSSNPQKS